MYRYLMVLSLLLTGCSASSIQPINVQMPAGYRLVGHADYQHTGSKACRSGYSIGAGAWMYEGDTEQAIDLNATAEQNTSQLQLASSLYSGLCLKTLTRVHLDAIPANETKPYFSSRIRFVAPKQPSPKALHIQYNCEHSLSLNKHAQLQRSFSCWPKDRPEQHRRNSLSQWEAPLPTEQPLPISLVILQPNQPRYLGNWVESAGNRVPYRVVRGQSAYHLELVSFTSDDRICHSAPSCDNPFDAEQAQQDAVRLENAKVWLWHQQPSLAERILQDSNLDDWLGQQMSDLKRWKWARTEQTRFLLAARATLEARNDLAWEPRAGEDSETHYQRCRRQFSKHLSPQ